MLRVCAAISLAFSLALSATAHAELIGVVIAGESSGDPAYPRERLDAAGSASVTWVSPGSEETRAEGSLELDYARVRVDVLARQGPEPVDFVEASAQGVWIDTFTLHTESGLTSGRLLLDLQLVASAATADGSGSVLSAIAGTMANPLCAGSTCDVQLSWDGAGEAPSSLNLDVPFLFGQSFQVVGSLTAFALVDEDVGDASLTAELVFRSLRVVDESGAPVPFSLESGSGYGWVPEPAVAPLLLVALAGLARRVSGS